jgi:hypothetical protein
MLGRRLLLLMAVLLGLTALATSLAPRPGVSGRGSGTPAPPSSADSRPAPGTERSRVVERTLVADPGARPAVVLARVGDTIRLMVKGDILDSVELEGLDEIEPVEPGSPARFEVLAEERGDHAIRLMDADRRIGRLDIR